MWKSQYQKKNKEESIIHTPKSVKNFISTTEFFYKIMYVNGLLGGYNIQRHSQEQKSILNTKTVCLTHKLNSKFFLFKLQYS